MKLTVDEMDQRGGHQSRIEPARQDGQQMTEWLFTLPAFYAEFAPPPEYDGIVDHLSVLKDCGLLTADRREFASPFTGLSFSFRATDDETNRPGKVAVLQPSFGHRKRDKVFDGWAFAIKSKASQWRSGTCGPAVARCQTRLAQIIGARPSHTDILEILDRLLDDLAGQPTEPLRDVHSSLNRAQFQVQRLATLLGQSGRTLQRRMRAATGLPPKQFLAVERFRRAVHGIPTQQSRLSRVAGDLGFSDQAHLTREFQRHAGLTPGAFQQTWDGVRGQAVRFVQDGASPTRLRVAVWPAQDRC